MFKWNGRTYRPAGPGANYKRVNPVNRPLDTRKVGVQLIAQFIYDVSPETPTISPSVTPTPSVTATPAPTPTPSATPPAQYFILAESGDILQAENLDLLVLQSAP